MRVTHRFNCKGGIVSKLMATAHLLAKSKKLIDFETTISE